MMTEHATRSLGSIQNWMQCVIAHPFGIAAGIASEPARSILEVSVEQLESVICRSKSLDSVGRLTVYGNAFFARLLDCLAEEFPTVMHVLGEDAFNSFGLEYLQSYPSRSYTLNDLGRDFPEFLRRTRPADIPPPGWPDFLIDLATVERTYAEVFDGPGIERIDELVAETLQAGFQPLSQDVLQSISEGDVDKLVLQPAPCLRLLELRFPVHDFITSIRKDTNVAPPTAVDTYLVVTRRDYIVRRLAVTRSEFELLQALSSGQPLGNAILAMTKSAEESRRSLESELRAWFKQWVQARWFVGVAQR